MQLRPAEMAELLQAQLNAWSLLFIAAVDLDKPAGSMFRVSQSSIAALQRKMSSD
jgi:hypothetical protein